MGLQVSQEFCSGLLGYTEVCRGLQRSAEVFKGELGSDEVC